MKSIIDQAVDRFLGWKLPADFAPDAGITFKASYNETSPFGPSTHEPVGTNLFTADQAKAMFTHCIGDLPQQGEAQPVEYLLDGLRVKLNFNGVGNITSLQNLKHDLQGRWVAFVGAENDKHLTATHPPAPTIAAAIHYPDCWDVVAYPTLESALSAVSGSFKCSECPPSPMLVMADDVTDEILARVFPKEFIDLADAGHWKNVAKQDVAKIINAYNGLTLEASK